MQDSFVTIFDKVGTYKHLGSFEGWMKKITINTALQKYKNSSYLEVKNDLLENKSAISEDEKKDAPNADILLKLVQQLPDRYRLVFNLYVLDEYSHKEIAALLDISEGTSKSNLSRARTILKTKVQEYQKTIQS